MRLHRIQQPSRCCDGSEFIWSGVSHVWIMKRQQNRPFLLFCQRRHLLEILCCQTLSDIFQWTEKGCDRHHVAHHPAQPTHPFCIFPPHRLKKEKKKRKKNRWANHGKGSCYWPGTCSLKTVGKRLFKNPISIRLRIFSQFLFILSVVDIRREFIQLTAKNTCCWQHVKVYISRKRTLEEQK